ncbi:Polysaccharide lyase, partial [Globisporangium splendens]
MLTHEAFCMEAQALAARSREAAQRQKNETSGGDASSAVWEWRHGTRPHLAGNAYLESTGNAREWPVDAAASAAEAGGQPIACADEEDLGGDISDLLTMHEDEAILAATLDPSSKQTQTVICDFHIVYHVIYQTPVLYFRATRLDGSPVRINAQIGGLHLPGSKADSTFVSMEEHPVLGTPFWFLHPCETSAAMELLLHQQCPTSETPSDIQYPKHTGAMTAARADDAQQRMRKKARLASATKAKATAKPTAIFAFGSRIPLAARAVPTDKNAASASPSSGMKHRNKRRISLNPAGDDSTISVSDNLHPSTPASSNRGSPALMSKTFAAFPKTSGLPQPTRISATLQGKSPLTATSSAHTRVVPSEIRKQFQQLKRPAPSHRPPPPRPESVLRKLPEFPPVESPDFWRVRLEFAQSMVKELKDVE